MSTGLQLRDADTMGEWGVMREQAAMLVKSNFLPKAITTPEQALAIILTGHELGIGTMAALNNINVIQGKPTVPPQLMLALINRSGQLEDMAIEANNDGASCTIKRKGRQSYTARFGPAEARAMGLDGKDNYKKQPATMYKWRAIADAARVVFPDVILGLYLPDEMGATVEAETGEVIEAAPEPTQTQRSKPEPAAGPMDVASAELSEPEPQPVKQVKLEGQQPTDAQWGPLPKVESKAAWHVIKLAKEKGWNEGDLAQAIEATHGTVIMPGHLRDYLEFAQDGELRELYRAVKEAK